MDLEGYSADYNLPKDTHPARGELVPGMPRVMRPENLPEPGDVP